jgi:cytochrome o ubiquinol oxidase subunit II
VQSIWSLRAGVLDPHGPIGAAQKLILLNATSIMLAVIVPVIVLTLVVAWWFRAGNTKAHYRPDWAYSGPVELVVWSIPALIVIFLGGIAWIGSHDLDPPRPIPSANRPLDIQVVSLDWKWLFIYPNQGIASVNHLVVPVGTPLRFSITSATVMNSFFVPQLGSQIYAMGGMTTHLYLQADNPGIYPGLSAQFSGDGFADMRFDVDAVTPDRFAQWVTSTRAGNDKLDKDSYASLARPGTLPEPVTFATIAPGMFDTIVKDTVK